MSGAYPSVRASQPSHRRSVHRMPHDDVDVGDLDLGWIVTNRSDDPVVELVAEQVAQFLLL
jgi:hypothetical protein